MKSSMLKYGKIGSYPLLFDWHSVPEYVQSYLENCIADLQFKRQIRPIFMTIDFVTTDIEDPLILCFFT